MLQPPRKYFVSLLILPLCNHSVMRWFVFPQGEVRRSGNHLPPSTALLNRCCSRNERVVNGRYDLWLLFEPSSLPLQGWQTHACIQLQTLQTRAVSSEDTHACVPHPIQHWQDAAHQKSLRKRALRGLLWSVT